jgi:hypothetical protein
MRPAVYLAASRIRDKKAPGGFSRCGNYPIDIGTKDLGEEGKISLIVTPDEAVLLGSHRGIALHLVNRSNRVAAFAACDSRLYIVQEALSNDGLWLPIEWSPPAICYRSFHQVFLKRNECWEFPAPQYRGPVKTKIRFRLDPNGDPAEGTPVYSNEFDGSIDASQFERKAPRETLS